MKDNRPVNLDLTSMKFPLPAIVSILHRISGVCIFVAFPFLLWALSVSLHSEQGFLLVKALLTSGFVSFLLFLVLAGIIYHIIAGIRHLFMDLGYFEGLSCARACARLVLIAAIIIVILMGIWLWV